MKKVCTINFYSHVNTDAKTEKEYYMVELEIVNEITGAVKWAAYTGDTRQAAMGKAKAQATKAEKRFISVYG